MFRKPACLVLLLFCLSSFAQSVFAQPFTREDTLRGTLTPERSCFDVTYYDLDLRVDPATKTIRGNNAIHFRSTAAFSKMQIELHHLLNIEKIVFSDGRSLKYDRDGDFIFVHMPKNIAKGEQESITVFYGGTPLEAHRPPWEGGISWDSDSDGNPWIAVTCQGDGANLWWPLKDHQSDEPDSMMIRITAPPGLQNVSNGRLRGTTELADGWTRSDWFVSNPINSYCVTMNIAKYAHFRELYTSKIDGDTLTLDYYVLPENLEKAKKHFAQVHGMMDAFEKYFGKYPFYDDGFKLVDCSHTGMEHQSAVAYGNWYIGGYRGRAPAAVGLKFDFIIVHETAHEWWGNNVTSNDIADMWIHESFGAYAEALYIEEMWGYGEALKYINGKKQGVLNDIPIQGIYNVQKRGSGDMYNKGQLVLNTLRNVIADDALWIEILRGLQQEFRLQSIDAVDVFNYINQKTGKNLDSFFAQYFQTTDIPKLEIMLTKMGDSHNMRYRWVAEIAAFDMPVKVTTAPGKYEFIHPTTEWQNMEISNALAAEDFRTAEDLFYIESNIRWTYLYPGLDEIRKKQENR